VDESLTLKFGHKWSKIWPHSGRTATSRVEPRRWFSTIASTTACLHTRPQAEATEGWSIGLLPPSLFELRRTSRRGACYRSRISRDRRRKATTAIRNRSRWSRPQSGRPSQARRKWPGRTRKADLLGVVRQVTAWRYSSKPREPWLVPRMNDEFRLLATLYNAGCW